MIGGSVLACTSMGSVKPISSIARSTSGRSPSSANDGPFSFSGAPGAPASAAAGGMESGAPRVVPMGVPPRTVESLTSITFSVMGSVSSILRVLCFRLLPREARADFVQALANAVKLGGLVVPETKQLFRIAGLGFTKLFMNHRQVVPFFGQPARAPLLKAAAAAGSAPLAEPERLVLGPALRLLGVVVRHQMVEVFEVLLEAVGDVGQLLVAALDLGDRRFRADGRPGRDRVLAPVDRDADGDQQIDATQRHEGEDEQRDESPIRTKLSRRLSGLSGHDGRRSKEDAGGPGDDERTAKDGA